MPVAQTTSGDRPTSYRGRMTTTALNRRRATDGLTAGDVMTSPPITVGMDATLLTVGQTFETHGFHHLLVVEGRELVGVVSDRDLLKALSPYLGTLSEAERDRATERRPVHQVMSHRPVTTHPGATLGEVAALFAEHGVSCVPVVDAQRHPLGVISWRDLMRIFMPELARR